ncbi:hypothetical protein, partial [Armatimonas sp.]|uniref:hypothetical protein n=1 Tax=Armatimonas sp. TaxID=1872638 RepID=UPI003751E352
LKGHLWAALRAKRAEPAEKEAFGAASGRLAKPTGCPLGGGLSGLGQPFVKKPHRYMIVDLDATCRDRGMPRDEIGACHFWGSTTEALTMPEISPRSLA